MKKPVSNTLIPLLALLLVVLLTAGCNLKLSSLEKNEQELKEDPCHKELEGLQAEIKQIDSAEGLESDIRKLVSVFKSMDASCEAEDELFGYALKNGRKNLPFLAALGYALYRDRIMQAAEERQPWTSEIWKDELRKKMLFEAWRMRKRYRLGKVSAEQYRDYIRPMTDFAVWNLRTLWGRRTAAEFPNMNPSEILVEDLEYLAHSTSTMLLYYSLFADHEILGNYRNFDMMRLHQNRLLKDATERCNSLELLANSGLQVLDMRVPLSIQAGENMSSAKHLLGPSMSPAFVRDTVAGNALEGLLIEAPEPPDSPYYVWPSGYSYILKPTDSTSEETVFIKALLKNDRQANLTDRERILQMLGKLEIEPFVEVRAELRNPRHYRLVGYIAENWLEEAEKICDVAMARLPGVQITNNHGGTGHAKQ